LIIGKNRGPFALSKSLWFVSDHVPLGDDATYWLDEILRFAFGVNGALLKPSRNCPKTPHPNPLPEYMERGKKRISAEYVNG
jgi:hypothetical protein